MAVSIKATKQAFELHLKLNNSQKAYEYYSIWSKLNDSINIEEKNDLTDYITSELLTKHTITKKESFDEIIKYTLRFINLYL